MANRVLRDWTFSENINQLSAGAEVFFIRLIMKADDYGCFYGNPMILNSQLYPLNPKTEGELAEWISELTKNKIVVKYEVEGKTYLKIDNFGQRLRIMKSKFPQPADTCQQSAVICPPETKRSEVETKRIETESETQRQPKLDINGYVIIEEDESKS
jgi:hypothetical protein